MTTEKRKFKKPIWRYIEKLLLLNKINRLRHKIAMAFIISIFCVGLSQPIQSKACGWAGDGESDDDDEVVMIGVDGKPLSEDSDDSGGPKYQNQMGNRYRKGIGAPKDYVEAARWYKMAADQGYAAAQNNLANLYEKGLGVEKNEEKAAGWFRLAAENGNAQAQHSLGHMLLEGRGTAQNFSQGAGWILKSAEQGHLSAMTRAGMLYWSGQGVKRDAVQAYRWWKNAALQGDKMAADQLAMASRKMAPNHVAEAGKHFTGVPLSQKKRTSSGLYLTAREAYAKWKTNPEEYKIIDVRTPGEYVFVGHPSMAYNIPIKFLETKWDFTKKRPIMPLNETFVSEVQKKFSKSDTLLVICRSGNRSALAVNLLVKAGYTNVYNITDGFEGDRLNDTGSYHHGKRILNGWKNSGAPWTYGLESKLMYLH